MTVAVPQRCTITGIVRKICFEAIVLVPYPDGTYRTGPKKDQPKHSQGGGSQTNYSVTPYREVLPDDPPITLRESLRWSLIGIEAREKDVNKKLEVEIAAPWFDMTVCRYYQKGNVRRPLPGEPLDQPTGPTFLDEACGFFNADNPIAAISSFMFYNSGAGNVPTIGHTYRCGKEIGFCSGDRVLPKTYPYFEVVPLTKENRQERPVQELFDILRELDPTRAV